MQTHDLSGDQELRRLDQMLVDFAQHKFARFEPRQCARSSEQLPWRLRERVARLPAATRWIAWQDEHAWRCVLATRAAGTHEADAAQSALVRFDFLDGGGTAVAAGIWELRQTDPSWALWSIEDPR